MSPEERHLLEETFKLTKENNKAIKSIKRRLAVGSVMRIVYWIVVLGAGVGIFYFLQPQLDNLTKIYGGFSDNVQSINSILGNGSQ